MLKTDVFVVILSALLLAAVFINGGWALIASFAGTPLSFIDGMCIGAIALICFSKIVKNPINRAIAYNDSKK